MVSSDIRKEARASLAGKWGKAALITFVYGIITYAFQWVANLIPIVGSIVMCIIEVPISYGIVVSFMKLKRGEDVSLVGFLVDGFNAFGRAWSVTLNIALKLIVPIILEIVFIVMLLFSVGFFYASNYASTDIGELSTAGGAVGIIAIIGFIVVGIWMAIKSLYYVLAMYVLKDNENLTGKEIVEKSAELMKQKRWSYVWLSITFIGWAILAGLTLGIGMFWLIPYIQVANIVFYEDKAGMLNTKKEEPVVETVKEN